MHCTSLAYLGCDCTGCCHSSNLTHTSHQARANESPEHKSTTATAPALEVHATRPSTQSQMKCKPTDDGDATQSCASFCNPIFAGSHCKFCPCATCSWCLSSNTLHAALVETNRPPPPLPPPPPPSTLQQINNWWRLGKPSNSANESGVILRVFDALSNVKNLPKWLPCPEEMWCAKYGAIWPSSIVNKLHNAVLYQGQFAGLVLAPPPRNQLLCIYPRDGNSMGNVGASKGCQRECDSEARAFDCSFPPERLESALRVNADSQKYNEVVIDAQFMKANLPHSILGVFYVAHAGGGGESKELAVDVHAAFLSAFAGQVRDADFPLMAFRAGEGFALST